MGKVKALLEINGKTFLENAVNALRPHCSSVKIVLNRSQTHFIEKIPANIRHISDIFENRGALGGIHAALQNCETEFAIILAVDLPIVSSETIEKLSEIAIASDEFSAIVPCQNDGRLQPLCAVYRVKDCLRNLEETLLKNNSDAVRDFLKFVSVRLIKQNCLADDRHLFLNVNNQNDFSKAVDIKNI